MTSRERVLETLAFHPADRLPYDLTDGRIWPELREYFLLEHGLRSNDEIFDFLGTDFRWIEVSLTPEAQKARSADSPRTPTETADYAAGPLASARIVDDVHRLYRPDLLPSELEMPDFRAFRRRWPDHAVVLLPYATAYFWTTCRLFGMERALTTLADAPEVYRALLDKLAVDSHAVLEHFLERSRGFVDVVELWDDVAGQAGMLVDPAWWRRVMRPYLAAEVEMVHSVGARVLFHSCGAVRPILADLVEIGVDALEVFQVNAAGMEPRSVARELGGKRGFYGGIDVQHLLSCGTREEVAAQVRHNAACFRASGGYVVANCHSHIRTVQGRNIVAMCEAARECR